MLDYIVVGSGIAGITFCETLHKHKKTFMVFDDTSQQATKVAGGLYNPVVLKRFSPVWMAREQMAFAQPFYQALEKKLGVPLLYPSLIKRRFASVEEQNLWFEACDHPLLKDFLKAEVVSNNNPGISAPYGFGIVTGTGRLDTVSLLTHYSQRLAAENRLRKEAFDFSQLELSGGMVNYKGLQAKQLVFATGFGMSRNPYFKYLPIQGSKGEYLRIKSEDLGEEDILKSAYFIIPMGNNEYLVGATYAWKDEMNTPTEKAREVLVAKLKQVLLCDFEVVGQQAGIRPTVVDRRPLAGRHPEHKQLYALNGFGSRGVMLGPWAAHQLFEFIEGGKALHHELDLDRFTKKYFGKDQAGRES